jgi:hypothetical protein
MESLNSLNLKHSAAVGGTKGPTPSASAASAAASRSVSLASDTSDGSGESSGGSGGHHLFMKYQNMLKDKYENKYWNKMFGSVSIQCSTQ